MATIQQTAQHWRDRAMAQAEVISDGWQVFLAWSGRAAEVILFICMAFSLVQAFPAIHMPEPLTGAVLVIQMITLDVAGFGLSSLAKQVRRAGDEATAKKAGSVGTILICIMIISFLSVVINNLFGKFNPSLGPVSLSSVMTGIDYIMILARVVMTVLYGRIIHSLRESQQDAQAQADETEAKLKQDLEETQANQRKAEESVTRLSQQVTDLQQQLHEAQQTILNNGEGQGKIILSLQKQVADLTTQLQDKQQISSDLQTARSTIFRLQNAEQETAKLHQQVQALTTDLQTANSQRADLAEKLERTKKKLADLQKPGEQQPRQQRREATGDNITSLEKARAKNRMSHAEVLAFMNQHSGLTRAEVAAKLEISERKVYDAVAWGKENLQGENAASQ